MDPAFLPCPSPFLGASPRIQRCPARRPRPSVPVMKRKRNDSQRKESNSDAPRISSNSGVSLRQQLAAAKLASSTSASESGEGSKPRERTRFRRKKPTLATDANGTRAARVDPDMPEGKYELDGLDPLVLIDAYNVVGAWAKLRKFRARGDLDGARTALVEEVMEFSSTRGWDCVVVFDAHGNADSVKCETTAGVEVVFTGSENADTFIERRVFELVEAGERQVWVATNDVAERQFAQSKGAHVMSASLFVQEMKKTKRESKERVDALRVREGSGRASKMLIRNVDDETRQKLYDLRAKLDGGG